MVEWCQAKFQNLRKIFPFHTNRTQFGEQT